jgi:hypothetical protein
MHLGDIHSPKHRILHPCSESFQSTVYASKRIAVRFCAAESDVPGQERFHVGGLAAGVSHDLCLWLLLSGLRCEIIVRLFCC